MTATTLLTPQGTIRKRTPNEGDMRRFGLGAGQSQAPTDRLMPGIEEPPSPKCQDHQHHDDRNSMKGPRRHGVVGRLLHAGEHRQRQVFLVQPTAHGHASQMTDHSQ